MEGFDENLPRVMPKELSSKIELSKLRTPKALMSEIFKDQQVLNIQKQLTNVFNLGVGVVMVCDEAFEEPNHRRVFFVGCLFGLGEIAFQKIPLLHSG